MLPRGWAQGLVGTIVGGRYRLDRLAGHGAKGAVFQATQLERGQTVALKLIVPRLVDRRQARDLFRREAETAAAAGGGGTVAVLDFGEDPACGLFLVMEFLTGESLADRLTREGALPPRDAVAIVAAVLATLEAVHAHGVVHRDLKPANVFLSVGPGGGPAVKLLDFGMARLIRRPRRTELRRSGAVLGTPAFMAPEQARGDEDVDHRTDLYALGAILYYGLAGRRPYEGDAGEILAALLAGPPTSLRELRPGLPDELYRVVETAMASARDRRYPDAAMMRADLLRAAARLAP